MRVLQINAVPYGSTGRIMFQLADALEMSASEALCTSGFTWKSSDRPDFFLTSGIVEKTIHTYLARFTGRIGCFSHSATRKLLSRIDRCRPDVIHLHNLHGWFVNLPMLFSYIKEKNIPVVWTFHDCWPMTGQCPHFDMIGCLKWKTGCHHCPQYRSYPQTWSDRSEMMYQLKKDWFTGVKDLTIVTPSAWMEGIVKASFLKGYPVEVIHNGIDLNRFAPCASDIRNRLECEDKKIVLGVAYAWNRNKGLDVFAELAERLGEEYRVVLVGTDTTTAVQLPESVVAIPRTQDQEELTRIYSAADVFVNPSREDTYPTVNMEALACGTPVVTFDTGGSPEMVSPACGRVVPRDDIAAMEAAIREICSSGCISKEDCTSWAKQFSQETTINTYLALYRRIHERTAKNGI